MGSVLVRFYAELGDLLPASRQGRQFAVAFSTGRTVKDLIEGMGVPHTEVDLILVDGASVSFAHVLADGERVSVYPVFEALDISAATKLRAAPLREPRFILDVHLGRLAVYLRLAGFDSVYRNDLHDEEIVRTAFYERRIIVTRDRGLLKRRVVTHGYLVRAKEPRAQLREVVDRFDLGGAIRAFSRCPVCNGRVDSVEKGEVLAELPPHTAQTQEDFCRCRDCGHVYWKGSHYAAISRLLDEMRAGVEGSRGADGSDDIDEAR